MADTTQTTAPAGCRLGDPIALWDLVALPPGDRRYGRDAQGRLVPMSPDDAPTHRWPIGCLIRWLVRALPEDRAVLQEPGVAFEPIWSLRGERLPASRLGRKTLGPDLAVYEGRPRFLLGQPDAPDPRYQVFAPDRLRLAVEFLSRRTRQSDLGLGNADAVDRWRTYLDNGVDEYWVLNAGPTPCGLPPRAGIFLRNAGDRWEALPSDARGPGQASWSTASHRSPAARSAPRPSGSTSTSTPLGAPWRARELDDPSLPGPPGRVFAQFLVPRSSRPRREDGSGAARARARGGAGTSHQPVTDRPPRPMG